MDNMQSGYNLFGAGIMDTLLLFLVIPFSIPTFIGYHLWVLKRRRQAAISFGFSFLIALIYIAWIGFLSTFLIFVYISIFYLLVMGPFWLLEKGIKWYEKKFIYEKYKDYLANKKQENESAS